MTLKSKLLSAAKKATTVPAAKAPAKAQAKKPASKDDALAIPDFLNAKNPKRAAEIAAGAKRPAQSVRAIDAAKVAPPKAKAPAKKGREAPAWVPKVIELAKRESGIHRDDIKRVTGWAQPPQTQVMARAAKVAGLKVKKLADGGYRLVA